MFKKILELQMTILKIVKQINVKLEELETKVNGDSYIIYEHNT